MDYKRVGWYLFIFSSAFYLSITSGTFWESDSQTVYFLAKNIIENGDLQTPCVWGGGKSFDGKCYSQYGLFMSFVVIPFYLLEKLFRDGLNNTYFFPGFFASLSNIIISSFLVVLAFNYLKKLKFDLRYSVVGAFIFGFVTYIPIYTKTLFSEPLVTLLFFLSVYILLFWKKSSQNFFLAGYLLGLALLTKIIIVIYLPILGLFFLINEISIKKIVNFIVPILLCFIAFLTYNYVRYENMFDSGYRTTRFDHPFLYGLYLHLLSPGKSFFLYMPVLIFAFWGWKYFFQKQKLLFIIFLLFSLANLFLYSVYMHPMGDLTWGSRYLYPTLLFFVISAIYFLYNNKSIFYFRLFIIATILTIGIQLSAIFLSYHRYFAFLNKKLGENFLQIAYNNIGYSPILGQWKMIFRLGYKNEEENYWKEAFQEYHYSQIDYKIASPDLFFLRSKRELPTFLILAGIQIYCLVRIYRILRIHENK